MSSKIETGRTGSAKPHQEGLDEPPPAHDPLAIGALGVRRGLGSQPARSRSPFGHEVDFCGDLRRIVALELDQQDRFRRLVDGVAEERIGVAGQVERATIEEVAG